MKCVLDGGQGTEPPEELDSDAPTCSGKMDPRNPTPPKGQQTSEEREDDEGEMGESDDVSESLIEHWNAAFRAKIAPVRLN